LKRINVISGAITPVSYTNASCEDLINLEGLGDSNRFTGKDCDGMLHRSTKVFTDGTEVTDMHCILNSQWGVNYETEMSRPLCHAKHIKPVMLPSVILKDNTTVEIYKCIHEAEGFTETIQRPCIGSSLWKNEHVGNILIENLNDFLMRKYKDSPDDEWKNPKSYLNCQ
jgi:hypothetical protein